MPTTLGFKPLIDMPEWYPAAPALNSNVVGACLTCDLRNDEDRDPYLYYLTSHIALAKYHVKNDEWGALASPALQSAGGVGIAAIFTPSAGPYGLLAAGATNTIMQLATALPAAVAVNALANRGDGVGYKIRIIGNSAGSSGLTEIKTIINNTGGLNPVITLDSALTFVPLVNDSYELLSGKVFLLGSSATIPGSWRSYDIATNLYTTLSVVNLLNPITTDTTIFCMDESYTPSILAPYLGFFDLLTATASAPANLTGQAAGGDATILAEEYRNFQIRIVQDVAIPQAAGQRRKIISHTAGASPVYTVAAWAVQPSANAIFVIEYNNDIVLWSGISLLTFSYLAGFNADAAWSTSASLGGATQYANLTAAHTVGSMILPSFGITLNTAKNARHSYFYYFRGGTSPIIDLFDIAGGATGLWTANIITAPFPVSYGSGNSAIYDNTTKNGKYGYIQTVSGRFFRFDILNRVVEPYAYLRYTLGTILVGQKLAISPFIDGTTKISTLFFIVPSSSAFMKILNQ